MKKILRIAMLAALCAVMLCMATACGAEKVPEQGTNPGGGTSVIPNDPDTGDKPDPDTGDKPDPDPGDEPEPDPGDEPEPLTGLSLQLDRVKTAYDEIYASSARNGGLFASPNELKFAAATAAESGLTIEDVRDIIDRNAANGVEYNNAYLFSTYVSDIFAYTQIQKALTDTHGKASLVNEYELEYDDIDWKNVDTGGVGAYDCQCSLLKTANIVGADEETGRVYGYQTHVSRAKRNVKAIAEYYFDSDADLGVTTINRHYNPTTGAFVELVYHRCDIKTGAVLEIHYAYNTAGDVTRTQAVARTKTLVISKFAEEDETNFLAFASAEIERITGKADEISAANRLLAAEEEVEIKEGVQTCRVPLDFAVLRTMVGTLLSE